MNLFYFKNKYKKLHSIKTTLMYFDVYCVLKEPQTTIESEMT